MSVEIFFLGTNASTPHKYRNLPSVVIRRKGLLYMFDCGEGAQYRFLRSGLGVNKRMHVFISHLHGDHVFGLPGMLHTFSLMGRREPLFIYGPKGTREFVKCVLTKVPCGIGYSIYVRDLEEGIALESRELVIKAIRAKHTLTNFAYVFEEKPKPGRFDREKALKLGVPEGPLWRKLQYGKAVKSVYGTVVRPEDVLGPPRPGIKVVYTGDTAYCERVVEAARGADVLIHDATFDSEKARDALETGHSTAAQAARAALESRAKFLFLFHYSSRYSDLSELLQQAREIFRRTYLSEDGLKVEIRKKNGSVYLLFSEYL